jgi:hypothetical protein
VAFNQTFSSSLKFSFDEDEYLYHGSNIGRIILQQVDKALHATPGEEALLMLLQIADPWFEEGDWNVSSIRDNTWRIWNLWILNPVKHRGDDRVAQRFLNVSVLLLEHRKTISNVNLPLQFHVHDTWRCSIKLCNEPVPTLWPAEHSVELERIMALQCINCRGAIAHGKNTELR